MHRNFTGLNAGCLIRRCMPGKSAAVAAALCRLATHRRTWTQPRRSAAARPPPYIHLYTQAQHLAISWQKKGVSNAVVMHMNLLQQDMSISTVGLAESMCSASCRTARVSRLKLWAAEACIHLNKGYKM